MSSPDRAQRDAQARASRLSHDVRKRIASHTWLPPIDGSTVCERCGALVTGDTIQYVGACLSIVPATPPCERNET